MSPSEIFVSYSHRDRRWLDELLITLAPLIRKQRIVVWDDSKILPGQDWKAEIKAALQRAKIAVLLVTRKFLASDFISNEEMPRMLEAAKKAGLTVVWIAVGASLYEETEITEYQAANDPEKPLNSLTEAEVDLELVRIAKKLTRVLPLEPAEQDGEPALGTAVQEAAVPEALLDQIVEERTAPRSSNGEEARKIISDFVEDALTPAHRRIREELATGEWAWRSIHALAAKAGVDEKTVLDILRADPDVELGRARTGKALARLRTKVET
jgi:hypothetical protein